MHADLVAFRSSPEPDDFTRHERRLRRAYHTALIVFLSTLKDVGCDLERAPLRDAYLTFTMTARRRESFWESKIKRLGRVLLSVAKAPEQRAAVLRATYGRIGEVRDLRLLTPTEARLIRHYRAIDDRGRLMLRELVDRLASSSPATPEHNAQED